MREFKQLTPYREALEMMLNDIKEIEEIEELPLDDALGRVLAEDVISLIDLPPFDRSAVDGYAVRAEDTFQAREYSPVELEVIDEITAGMESKKEVSNGKAVKLMTGNKMPKGANAVIEQEKVKREGNKIYVLRPVAPGQNVAFKGEDVKKGEVVLKKGQILRPQDLGLLKGIGIKRVTVKRRPKVGIIVTGDELIEEPDEEALNEGKILESNSAMLKALIRQYFGESIFYGVIPDDEELIGATLERAKCECDLVLITGGSAFGEKDYAHKFVNLLFHGTTIKPGRPIGYGERIFVMSGYPAAVFAQFHLYVKYALAKLSGANYKPTKVKARLKEKVPSSLGRHEFVKVYYENGEAVPIKKKGSGIMSALVESNAYLEIPEDSEGYKEGEEVWVVLY
ncbi:MULTISPECIES: gephyrin-like molybdotransferase Glp [Thermococcus]|uniref:Molybdenum cofactor biosynthesis protein MoeA n=1 Tax=Thermococcus sibiricus (strain DSM 12597 / MM 739) TaxID=604354 RepID=C6A326_THESM|nr:MULTISPECIES: gephyrin-like molybdotransferase Glp [Thermococcus]ACS90021.1 Molybdenum cofactor biosynthesis protein MoeA [Thermococcus sibiricus MM 739]MBC7095578.1 molybdopterin molybdotransferase MoeA [Thermococcus sp.]